MNPSPAGPRPELAAFQTTRWTLVRQSADPAAPDAALTALTQLCQAYWYPLYAFARRSGLPVHDAQDATQGFFSHLIQAGTLTRARAELGRFRTFLLGSMRHYLAKERRHHAAQKRGGGALPVPLDELHAEQRYAREPADLSSPDLQFERSWAFALLESVFTRLAQEYTLAGRAALFAELRPFLAGESARPGYQALADRLGLSAAAIATAIHRMRRRYGELLRDEIAQTVTTPAEVEEEIAHLMAVVSGA